jgi:hypothetical protein
MTPIEILMKQTENAYDWTNRLISDVPFSKWDNMPPMLQTNISWQVGHLIMSHYFHSVMVIVGHQKDIVQKIPLKHYNELFIDTSPEHAVGRIAPELLLEHLGILQTRSIEIIRSLSLEDLENKLEPTPVSHPIAQTKYEAIDWNIKHTMYHCGQIGMVKRIVDVRHDFGLRRPK